MNKFNVSQNFNAKPHNKHLMKILNLVFLVLAISCSKSQSNLKINQSIDISPTNKNCENTFQFGKAFLCVPKIKGMQNIIFNSKSKDYIQSKNYPGNTVVAYYVNEKIYENLEILYSDQFDDFFQIFVTNNNENQDVNDNYFKEINEGIKEYLNSSNWNDLKKKLENLNENNVFEKPIIAESYALSSNSIQHVTLVTIKKDNIQKNMIAIGNMFIINNRLFYATYNHYFQNSKSIEEAKKRNDEIMLQILKLNE